MSDSPLTAQQITQAALQSKKEAYVHRVLVGLDQFTASVFGVQHDQTISSEAEIDAHKKIWFDIFSKGLNKGLDVLQASHGEKAQVGDIVRDKKDLATDEAALSKETGLSPAQVDAAVDAANPTQ